MEIERKREEDFQTRMAMNKERSARLEEERRSAHAPRGLQRVEI